MSGHSKWSKVKHQKATTDAVKSREFTKASRALTVAVKEGGGLTDPDKNFRLRLAIELAKSVNMPKHFIERAIERAVSFQFTRNGVLLLSRSGGAIDVLLEAALTAGADDVVERDDVFEVYTAPGAVSSARRSLEAAGFSIEHADLVMKPMNPVSPPDDIRSQNEQLVSSLEALDDVQRVFTSME